MARREKQRCSWCKSDPLCMEYHDAEWGVPAHDDAAQFEHLTLESAQAGLSWLIVLRKREGYRKAFAGFDAEKVARFTEKRIDKLVLDPAIIRNRQKINAAVNNARRFLEVQQEFGSFDEYIWRFVDGRPVKNAWKREDQIPAVTPQAEALSKDLKGRGFKFVGPTIMYAHMQAVGLVNDHLVECYRYKAINRMAARRR